MVNSQFAMWLRRNAGTKKESSALALSGKFFKHSDSHGLLIPRHVGFKYFHYNLESWVSLKNCKTPNVRSKSKHWKNMFPESLPVI